jgi:hypothetical protein
MQRGTLFRVVMVLVVTALTLGTVMAASDNLPGGTLIEVDIDDPVTCTDFFIPVGETTLDVDVSGTASVGEGVIIKDTTVVYVMDVSGSMSASAGVDCDGDTVNDTRLVCEKEGVKAANTAAADPNSSVDETGLASFATTGTAHDVDLGTAGTQYIVAPGYDGNTNSTPDIEDVAFGLAAGGNTCYHCGLSQALTVLASSTNAVNIVIFMSDGGNNTGPNVSTLSGSFGPGTTIHSFAMGTGVNCTSGAEPGGRGSLAQVAALTPGGTCTQVTDMSKLADLITEAIGSTLDSLEIEVDGGGKSNIDNADIDPDLPQDGPATVDYDTTVSDLSAGDHEICVTANGTDAGGSGSVEECVTIHLIQLVKTDIKPGSCPNPFNIKGKGVLPVAVLGSEDFDVTTIDPATIELTREGYDGVSPLRWSYEDVATPFEGELCDCHNLNGDGWMDLTLKFKMQEVTDTLGLEDEVGNTIPLLITGSLMEDAGGTPIQGSDCIWVLQTGKK